MSLDPAQDLVNFLATEGIGLTKGTNLFRGPERSKAKVPADAVFVYSAGGPTPMRVMGEGTEVREAVLSLRIRASKYEDGYSLSKNTFNAISAAAISGYLDTKLVGGEPTYIGPHEEGDHIWLFNVAMTYERTN